MIPVVITALVLQGCAKRTVERIGETDQIDLSGRWNDTDSQLVAEEMINDSLSRPWLTDYIEKSGKKPTTIVGEVKNRTHELIDTDMFIKDIERSYINSGKVRVVQAADARKELRAERADQQEFASPETVKRWGQELGADFIMQGTITSNVDSYKKEKVVTYQIDLELSHLETNETVWMGQKKIRKLITN